MRLILYRQPHPSGAAVFIKGENPTILGAYVTIGHSAIVHGAQVGDNVLIGMHATVLNGAVIGEGSIIGAGALVREGQVIPPRSVVIGMPAKAIKEATDAQVAGNIENARHYIELGKRYKG
ncbi:MAG: gamma carbonic anhydrase family protein [Clostridia bacterium]|nr:gamma carbonic anhydrase family protein [Clostridia bacterium]